MPDVRSRLAPLLGAPFVAMVLFLSPAVAAGQAVTSEPSGPMTVDTDLCVAVVSEAGVDIGSPGGLQQALLDGVARLTDVAACPDASPSATATPARAAETRSGDFKRLTKRAWAKLVKAPDKHIGRHYRVWGCISQFDAATGADSFRAQTSFRKERYWFTDGENALFVGDEARLEDFVTDDVVRMDVTALGSFSYDTQSGGSTTVPLFEVVTIARERGSC